ncbi:MAG: transposase [Desulfobacterales bacterium]
MRFHFFRDAVLNRICVKSRLKMLFFWYLLSMMTETRKHSLSFASEISGIGIPSFSRFLCGNEKNIVSGMNDLSKKQARIYSRALNASKNAPQKIFVVIDDVIQGRCSLKSENVQKFNHGHGFFIGHQWTNIILLLNGKIVPLPPIPFCTEKYCREKNITCKTSHQRLAEYISDLNLNEYIGIHISSDVIVLTDSGFDDKKIQKAVLKKKWHFICALKSSRGVKSEAKHAKSPKSSDWDGVAVFFKKFRNLSWSTVRIFTDGPKKRRTEFRIRHAEVFLKETGKIRAVCSEFRKKRGGCRRFFACSDLKMQPRQILIAYRLRWKIEIFHKHIKMHSGFQHAAAKHFSSVSSHVHLVCMAYILLHSGLPGTGDDSDSVTEKQAKVRQILKNRETACIIHELTKIGGAVRLKNELKSALTD